MKQKKKIAVLPGDGIGKEVVPEAIKVLNLIASNTNMDLEYNECLVGGASIDVHGTSITDETLDICKNSDAVLLGAVGGAKWDKLPLAQRPERALLALRKALDCFANLRPIWLPKCLGDKTPLKPELIAKGIDIIIIRELLNGLYYGDRGRRTLDNGEIEAYDTAIYSESAVSQVAKLAFEVAAKRGNNLVSMDKSNILETSRLWREIVTDLAKEHPNVKLKHQLIDSGAMLLMLYPSEFDVILVNNEFGDIISDEASVLGGSLGMIPSASIGSRHPYFFEPIHGSAPDIAGQGLANPIATILSAGMMLTYSFDMQKEARMVQTAVENVLEEGYRTKDIAAPGESHISTSEMGDLILKALANELSSSKS